MSPRLSPIPAGLRNKFVRLQNPTRRIADGDGGFTSEFEDFAETFASIETASASGLERLAAGTVIQVSSHIITIPFIDGVSDLSRVLWLSHGGIRTFDVKAVQDPTEDRRELILLATEVDVQTPTPFEGGSPA